MSESSRDGEDQNRAKIQNLINLYEKTDSSRPSKSHASSNQLSTKISDFAWPEREVSHTPKHATEIAISDYVSVKNLINVYQKISQQGTSPVVGRKDSYTKKIKLEHCYDHKIDHHVENKTIHPLPNTNVQKFSQEQKQFESPSSNSSFNSSGNKVTFSATSGLFDVSSIDEESPKSKMLVLSSLGDENYDDIQLLDDSKSVNNGFSLLPESYSAIRSSDGILSIELPPAKGKSSIKRKSKKKGQVGFVETPTQFIETYNVYEYERGDESLDPVASSAQYEIEKKTEKLEKFTVTLVKGGKGLGLSIVGIGLGSETGEERLGIYIKALTPGGVAETGGSLKVQDQILEVDGISLVGVSQKFAGETLKTTGQTVQFLIGREKVEEK